MIKEYDYHNSIEYMNNEFVLNINQKINKICNRLNCVYVI